MASFIHPLSGKSSMRMKNTDDFITARFPISKTGPLNPGAGSTLPHHTPKTLDEVLTLSALSKLPSSNGPNQSPAGKGSYSHSNSKEWPMESSSGLRTSKSPHSWKTSTTTILTETGNDQPVFESDAFAVNMPTTREPVEPHRSPSPAQIAAYQHYAEKARRNALHEYQTEHAPTTFVSYGYADERIPFNPHCILELDGTPPSSPTTSPGAFPSSPPVQSSATSYYSSGSRSASAPQHSIIHKPVGAGPSPRQSIEGNKLDHQDSEAGAENSPQISPIKAKPRTTARAESHRSSTQHRQPSEKPWWSFSTRPHRTLLPSSPKPTTAYILKETPGSWHTAPHIHPSMPTPPHHRVRNFGLAWLRPSSSRRTHTSDSVSSTTSYIDPFISTASAPSQHTLSRPLDPRNATRSRAGGFDDWVESVQRAAKLVAKVCLLAYVAVGVWYVLDAVREVVWVLSWPGRMVWMVCRWLGEAWERFGIWGPRRY